MLLGMGSALKCRQFSEQIVHGVLAQHKTVQRVHSSAKFSEYGNISPRQVSIIFPSLRGKNTAKQRRYLALKYE
jgi:hypothetical protein